VKGWLYDAGFDAVGIAAAEPIPVEVGRLKEVARLGYTAGMKYLTDRIERRENPANIIPGCRSVIVVAANYYHPVPDETPVGFGRIARYGMNRDYHKVMVKPLEQVAKRLVAEIDPTGKARVYSDTGAVMEKVWGEKAGIGFRGKNGLLILPQRGSFCHLGVILTTTVLAPDSPAKGTCGSCRLCFKACSTGALIGDGRIDARRCLTYLNIESDTPVPPEIESHFTKWLYGCDDCQTVCPYNVRLAKSPSPDSLFGKPQLQPFVDLKRLLAMDETEWKRMIAGTALVRAKFARLQNIARLILKNQNS